MSESRRLPVDLDDLCQALDDSSAEHAWYLDCETGEILLVSELMDDVEELRERLDAAPGRYELVPTVGSSEGYRDMEDFIETTEDTRLGELLEIAIGGRGAFGRYKDVLARFPEERQRWIRFKDDKLMKRGLEWLEEIGVEPQLRDVQATHPA
jgi:hypothetical protein